MQGAALRNLAQGVQEVVPSERQRTGVRRGEGDTVPKHHTGQLTQHEEGQKKVYQDGDTITVKEAKELGFKHVKAE